MRLIPLNCLLIAPVLVTTLATNALAQSLPRLIQDMPYGKARQQLISSGWQANEQNPMYKDESQRNLQKWFLDRGMTEVETCAGTGLGLCRAIFLDDSGKKLVLFTTSGSYGDRAPVIVKGWRFEE